MLKFSILDANFSIKNQRFELASFWLKSFLEKKAEIVTPDRADFLLCSLVATGQVDFLRKVKKTFPGKKIITGGAASLSPVSLLEYSNVVCVGDGQNFLTTFLNNGLDAACALPNALTQKSKSVEIDQLFPYDSKPIMGADGVWRVWAGRGCKNKCMFCQTGWAQTYSENPNPSNMLLDVHKLIKQNKKFTYLSNDTMQHSFFQKLPASGMGSFSYRFLKNYGLPHARHIRMGVEGVSERLRGAVNKAIPTEELIKCTSWLNANKKSVQWFMIAGLPGETREDWLEFKETVQAWKKNTPKGTLTISFTAWCPDPASPICEAPIIDDYWENYTEFKEWFFGGQGWSNKIILLNPQQPVARIEKAKLSMALSESELRKGENRGPNNIVQYPYKHQAGIAFKKFKRLYL